MWFTGVAEGTISFFFPVQWMFPFPNLNTLGKNESVANAERIFISLKAQNFSFQSFLYSFKEDKETRKTWRTDIVPFALVTG